MFSPEQISDIIGSPIENVRVNWPLICQALKDFGIYDRPVCMAAIATVGVEARGFKPIEEYRNADGSIPNYWHGYGGGANYHGRGLVQLTHIGNYQAFQDASGWPVVSNPNLLLVPEVSASALAWYFATHGGGPAIPEAARVMDWRRVRLLVNGGYNGWTDFANFVNVLSITPNDVIAESGGGEDCSQYISTLGYLTGDVADALQSAVDTLKRHKP